MWVTQSGACLIGAKARVSAVRKIEWNGFSQVSHITANVHRIIGAKATPELGGGAATHSSG